ncbi:MAG: hypothetical protein ABIJ61_01340 [bacterium]
MAVSFRITSGPVARFSTRYPPPGIPNWRGQDGAHLIRDIFSEEPAPCDPDNSGEPECW